MLRFFRLGQRQTPTQTKHPHPCFIVPETLIHTVHTALKTVWLLWYAIIIYEQILTYPQDRPSLDRALLTRSRWPFEHGEVRKECEALL